MTLVTIDVAEEVLSEHTRQAHAHVGHFVPCETEHFIFEILLEQVLFVHGLPTHRNKDLPFFEGGCFVEIFLNDLNY